MGETVALLDLGSNAVRFVLAKLDAGPGVRVIVEERVPTRLGSGLDGLLPRVAVDRTVHAARHFLERVSRKNPRVLAIATSAVREAQNREELLEALRELGPLDLRILTGSEEARLGAEAALSTLPMVDGTIADLGGGSLEVTRVRARRISSVASLPLGCTRLTKRFLRSDPPAPNEVRALRETVRELLGSCSASHRPSGPLVVLGGTVRGLARLHSPRRTTGTHGTTLRAVAVSRVRQWLETMTAAARRDLPGLKPDRSDVILAGALALEEIMLHGQHDVLTVSSASVREGVLLREAALLTGNGKSVRHERVSNRPPPPVGFEPFRPEAR
jgi:exopolyphosphatase/guanosine-5'-triphosphate,3'-diphosphate pyrophosphatase